MTVLTIMRYVRGDFVVTRPATPVKPERSLGARCRLLRRHAGRNASVSIFFQGLGGDAESL